MGYLRGALALIAVVTALAGPAFAQEAPARPTTPEGWRAVALSDLDAAREILLSQTPIPFDAENPAYPAWLEQGYSEARERAEQARDEAGYFFSLARYFTGFHDPHISVNPSGQMPAARWPGFIAASRAGGAVVVMRDEADAEAPPIGAQILSCEGRSLALLAEERLFPYILNERLALDRRRISTRLFMDRGIPGAPGPSHCRISHNGAERDLTLRWRALPEDEAPYWAAYQDASIGAAAAWGVSEPAAGVTWIGIPTFSSGSETAPQLEQLIAAINARGDAMRGGRAIVIDVRGNGGGNSAWADRIAAAVFGDRVAGRAALASTSDSAIDWRASPENIAYWREWMDDVAIPEFGANSEAVDFAREAISGMEGALDDDPPIWRQGSANVGASGGLTQRRPRDGARPFPARVYLLSNGTCGSSCLNFADTVLFVPGVQLIGSDTAGDGPYMEVRSVTLPSGLAQLTIPQKVWRGMGRGALEAYTADIAYDGAWDDASVRAWVMGLIAAQ
jgi:hypothetical protein